MLNFLLLLFQHRCLQISIYRAHKLLLLLLTIMLGFFSFIFLASPAAEAELLVELRTDVAADDDDDDGSKTNPAGSLGANKLNLKRLVPVLALAREGNAVTDDDDDEVPEVLPVALMAFI